MPINERQRRFPDLALNDEQWGSVAMLAAMVLWGTTYVAAKFALREMGPMMAAFVRFFIACVATWPVLLFSRRQQPIVRKSLPSLIGSALFQTTIYFALQYTGMRYTTAANTSLIVNTRPLIIAVLSLLALPERLLRAQWSGLMLAFVGVVVLVGGPSAELPPDHLLGDFLIVLNAMSGALGFVFAKRVLGYYNPFTALVYQITIGALGLLPLALIESGGRMPDVSLATWGVLVYLAIPCTAVPQSLQNVALSRLPVSKAAPFLYTIPILNVVFAHYLLGEPITWALVVGGALILAGTYLTNQHSVAEGQVDSVSR